MLRTLQEKAELLNSQYIEYNDSINRLTAELQRNVEMLGFAPADLEDARQYIKDKGKPSKHFTVLYLVLTIASTYSHYFSVLAILRF